MSEADQIPYADPEHVGPARAFTGMPDNLEVAMFEAAGDGYRFNVIATPTPSALNPEVGHPLLHWRPPDLFAWHVWLHPDGCRFWVELRWLPEDQLVETSFKTTGTHTRGDYTRAQAVLTRFQKRPKTRGRRDNDGAFWPSPEAFRADLDDKLRAALGSSSSRRTPSWRVIAGKLTIGKSGFYERVRTATRLPYGAYARDFTVRYWAEKDGNRRTNNEA